MKDTRGWCLARVQWSESGNGRSVESGLRHPVWAAEMWIAEPRLLQLLLPAAAAAAAAVAAVAVFVALPK